MQPVSYRGRFAPSPSGPLHFGSLLTALASYLDARSQGGEWWLRIDDLDPPRIAPGATDAILRALEVYGLAWDGAVQYQSRRGEAYAAALRELQALGAVYACDCTRREIADSNIGRANTAIYPGTCRDGLAKGRAARAWRLDTRGARVRIEDRLQGVIEQDLESACGDFIVRRADGLFAYQLAAVVDDAALGVTDIVRGADLLDSSLRQAYLRQLLGLEAPRHLHLPVVVNAAGEKLSKQTLAPALDLSRPQATLLQALRLLQNAPPGDLNGASVAELLAWALAHWNPAKLPPLHTLKQPEI
jgi:glutamyl-Q tRNA(Asp) synthetase